MNYIKNQEALGNKVAMFGDGVNDSLALRSAFAGIAMGGIGSDAVIESADAVTVHDNLDAVWGALFHNCGSVLVVISAFLLLFYKGRD